METGLLLENVPAFNGDEKLLVKRQSVDDLITWVMKNHAEELGSYDDLADYFTAGSVDEICRKLFDYCKAEIPYSEEPAKKQTVRTPAAFLEVGSEFGADCKHYANFIGGVLAAIERKTGSNFNFVYRFVSYDLSEPEPYHVFIVVDPGTEDELWVDPVVNGFNQQYPMPFYILDKKPKKMAIYKLSGVSQFKSINTVSKEDAFPGGGSNGNCMGCYDDGFSGDNKISGGFSDFIDTLGDSSLADTFGSGSSGNTSLVTTGLNAAFPGVGTAVGSAINLLGNNSVSQFLSSFLSNPTQALKTLISGHMYTFGDYALTEMYLRNILGMENVQSRQQVADTYDKYVPQAWGFFTTAMGVPIRTNDDLDALVQSGQTYLNRNPTETAGITIAQANRAAQILSIMPRPRDAKWDLSYFTRLPYIYPLPFITPGSLFTGTHPITGIQFSNGYPGSASVTPGGGTGLVSIGPDTTGGATPPPPGKGIGDFIKNNPLLSLGIAGGGVYVGMKVFGKKGKKVSGMKASNIALLVGAAVGGYLIYEHVQKGGVADKKKQLLQWTAGLTSQADVTAFTAVLNQATDDEINSLYDFVEQYIIPGAKLDPSIPLYAKIQAISTKYNIFT